MPETVIEKLFSLLTSPDRAEAMAGDLAEEREQRGWMWFWLHALGVTAALWRSAIADAPLRVLALTAAGSALVIAPAFGGAVAANVFPDMNVSRLWLGASGALFTGVALAAVARRLGFAASATLALVGLALVLACLVVVPNLAAAQENEWKDPSPHTVRYVTVEENVQLEVVDWGGSGPALLLLAGLGDTAHVFDDFAPLLTPRYHVVGLTRRAHGRSSAPLTGYEFARLAEDVVRVIDAAGLDKPVVIGHSFAGEELHALGARHSAKIAGLVYIDAAFNRGDDSDNEAYDAVARTLPASPKAGPSDMASFTALRAFLEKTQGAAFPESHLRARFVANPDGTIARMWAPDLPIRQAMLKAMQDAYKPYNPERIRVPALAIYAAPKSAADLMRPWYAADDPAIRERVEKLYQLERDRVGNHIKWFQQFAERGRVEQIAGAHHLFVSNPREVLQYIEAFLAKRAP